MDLKELRKIAEAPGVRPGPWHVYDRGIGYEVHDENDYELTGGMRETFDKADAEFIATFDPPTVLALITRLEQAEQDRVKLRNRLDAMRRQRDGYQNQLRKTEQQTNRHKPTKEKTMSKTFKCVEHEEEVLEVYPFTGDEAGRKFSLLMPHVSSNAGITFDSTTAPALALAILEAAGFDDVDSGNTSCAVADLRTFIARQERITAEAEAQAKLEAEALELRNEYFGKECAWSDINDVGQAIWLRMARKAREMAKEDTK